MSKQTPIKGRQGQPPPASQEHVLTSVRPSTSSSQAAPTSMKAAGDHATRAKGSSPTHEQIAARAYELWEAHGRHAGADRDDWLEAERLLRGEAR
ncbi:MAG: DUF2934 domain-containing protein [Isosphaeraceae bacterium]